MELDQMSVHALLEKVEKLDVQLSDERMRSRDLEIQYHDERRLREIADQNLEEQRAYSSDLVGQLTRCAEIQSELSAKLAAKDAELDRVRSMASEALLEAAESIDFWGSYADEYFQGKHDLKGCVDETKQQAAALASPEAEPKSNNEAELNGVRKFQAYMRAQAKQFGGDVGTAMLDAILTNYIQAQPAPATELAACPRPIAYCSVCEDILTDHNYCLSCQDYPPMAVITQPAPVAEPAESWEQTVNRIVPDFPDYAASHPASATWAVWTDRNRIREALLKLKSAPVAQSEEDAK